MVLPKVGRLLLELPRSGRVSLVLPKLGRLLLELPRLGRYLLSLSSACMAREIRKREIKGLAVLALAAREGQKKFVLVRAL